MTDSTQIDCLTDTLFRLRPLRWVKHGFLWVAYVGDSSDVYRTIGETTRETWQVYDREFSDAEDAKRHVDEVRLKGIRQVVMRSLEQVELDVSGLITIRQVLDDSRDAYCTMAQTAYVCTQITEIRDKQMLDAVHQEVLDLLTETLLSKIQFKSAATDWREL